MRTSSSSCCSDATTAAFIPAFQMKSYAARSQSSPRQKPSQLARSAAKTEHTAMFSNSDTSRSTIGCL